MDLLFQTIVLIPEWLGTFRTGAGVTKPIGLLGFIAAGIFLAYMVRTRAETKRLKLLPETERARAIDTMATRYGLTLENLRGKQAFDLVMREMTLRSRRQLIFALLSALVFLTCFFVVAFTGGDKRQVTAADERVIDYMRQIQNLRGDFEARDPGWPSHVRREGLRLADLIGGISENYMHPSRQILQHEYKGWALLMVARTFVGSDDADSRMRIMYAKQAIGEFDLALARMQGVADRTKTGDEGAAIDYQWMNNEGKDLYHTRYLKAIALAVMARSGRGATAAQVKAVLASIPDEYLADFPPTNNPDLKWALDPSGRGKPSPQAATYK